MKVRAVNGNVASAAGANLDAVQAVQQQFGLSFEQSIELPPKTLDFVESRAAQMSGIAQPDFAGCVMVTGPAVTMEQAANSLLALPEVEWVEFVLPLPEPPQACSDIPPTTPDYFTQGYQGYHGADPGLNMTCAWGYGGEGQNIRIADCEWAYRPLHEDRCTVNGPTLTCVHGFYEDHGTAVLGEMVSLSTAYGCTGLTPDAEPWFFSEVNQSTCAFPTQSTRATAIANAIANLRAGDVLLLEMQTRISLNPSPGSALAPAELNYNVWNLTHTATQAGIVAVVAAGNGSLDLDRTNVDALNVWRSWGDSGAIIVGAGTSDVLHDRLWFSTYGSRVNVQGWGENVFTDGYGYYVNHAPGDPDGKQTYTHLFSGTSSASPFVASAAASLQSIRALNGLSLLTSSQMRQLLIDTGIPQGTGTSAQHIGPFPDMGKAILQLGIGAVDCEGNGVPDECEPRGACCLGTTCSITTQSCCVNQGGTFSGVGTTCQIGACCVADRCTVTAQPCCSSQGGTFTGVGTTCQDDCNNNSIPDSCDIAAGTSEDCNRNGVPDECDSPTPFGACCIFDFPEVTCLMATQCSCDGNFQGPGTDCASSRCRLASGPSGGEGDGP